MKINISLLFSFLIFSSIFSQNSSVSGLVSDENTKETIPMANISLKKQTEIISGITNKTLVQGTVSDLNGNFTISNIEPGNYILECSFIGYKTFKKEIKLNSSEDKYFNILISEEVNLLGDVVISAGKFEQNIEEVTVSMDVIKPKLIKSKNPVNMEVMMNQSPGVNIVDGQANIRGGSGWSYNTGSRVLVMIDDMPFLSGDRGTVEWDMIPMENISQIEVIKGASSALFGSSALNGVINIRTEYPTNKPKTEVSIFQGFYDKAKRESLNWWGDNPQYFSGVSFSHAEYKNNTGIVFGGNIFNDFGYQKGVENRRGRFNFSTKKDWKKLKGLSHGLNGNFMYSHNDDAIMYTNDSLGYIPLDEDPANYTQMMMNIDPYISYVNPLNNTKHDLKVRFFRDDYNPNGGRAAYSNVFYSDYQFQKTWEDINSFLPFTLNHLVSTSGLTRNKIFAHDDEVYGGET
ncbi:TonB-dependent receptor [Bacteroidota bacterium]|nr:TonB-dependent receptor [Bacteroidota bacterium]